MCRDTTLSKKKVIWWCDFHIPLAEVRPWKRTTTWFAAKWCSSSSIIIVNIAKHWSIHCCMKASPSHRLLSRTCGVTNKERLNSRTDLIASSPLLSRRPVTHVPPIPWLPFHGLSVTIVITSWLQRHQSGTCFSNHRGNRVDDDGDESTLAGIWTYAGHIWGA